MLLILRVDTRLSQKADLQPVMRQLPASKGAFATNCAHERSDSILGTNFSGDLVPIALFLR